MSKSRKILGAVLAILLVLNVFAVSAFAAGATSYEADGHSYTQAWVVSDPQSVSGDTYQVTISLTTNYPVGPVSFKLEGVTEVTAIDVASAYYAGAAGNGIGGDGLVLLTVNTMDTVIAKEVNGPVAVVTYKAANAGGAVTIANNPKTAENPGGSLIATRVVDSETVNDANFVVGQTVTGITSGGASVVVATLQKTATAEAGVVIDTQKTFGGKYAGAVYGFNQTAYKAVKYITDSLEASDGSQLTITPAGKANYSTGTTVSVGGKVYVIVIFGDTNADGLINGNDVTISKNAQTDASLAPNDSILRMGANTQAAKVATLMHNINGNDTTALKAHVGGTKMDVAALAQAHFSANNNYQ